MATGETKHDEVVRELVAALEWALPFAEYALAIISPSRLAQQGAKLDHHKSSENSLPSAPVGARARS